MPETGAHPGVRSLLARFENNNNSNNQTTSSPPSRGRSPVGSEHSGSRPLSKVRASFIAVDGATQSGAIAGLRSVSSRSDSPAAPPSRVRSFNSDDLNAPLKSPLSSPISNGNGLDNEKTPNETTSGEMRETVIAQLASPEKRARPQAKDATFPQKESDPTPTVSTAPSPKKTQTITKRPSTIQVDRVPPNQSASKSTSTTLKSVAHPRTPTSPAKPDHDKASKPARSPRPPVARDSTKAPITKPSRSSLNTAAKTATRPVRSSMPATKSTATSVARTSRPESKPPTKPARLPASATTSTLSSTSRGGVTGSTTSSLSRKPSSLKSATSGTHRATTTSVRKQISQPSLQRQPAHERPHSRVSNTSSKAVDEGFLARMMRPTASSANKAHEKVDVKSPPRPSRVARAPVRPVSKMEAPKMRPTKETSVSKKPQGKPQPVSTEKEEPQAKAVDPKEDTAHVTAHVNVTEALSKVADEPVQAVIGSSVNVIEQELPAEKQSEDLPVDPSVSSENSPVVPSAELEQPIQAAEVPEEETSSAPSAQEPTISADETKDVQRIDPSEPSNIEETKEQTGVESPADIAEEEPAENVALTEVKVDDVDVDVGKLSLN